MKLISVNALKIGEMLSSDIRASNGNMLLRAKTVLTDRMIDRLKKVGIYSVYVDDDMFDDVSIRMPLTDETKARILGSLELIYQNTVKERKFDVKIAKDMAREIFEEVRIAALEPINMISTFAVDSPILQHSVNVAIITAMLALKANIRPLLAENYVLAALMHDMCLSDISNDNDGKYEHATKIYEALKSTAQIDATCYMSANMHHERFGGGGGPRKMAGMNINEGARMIAIADMFDNVTYGYAGYTRLEPYKTVEFLASQVNTILDGNLFNIFQKNIAIYPTGATVVITGNRLAAVIRQNIGSPTRPVLRLLSTNPADRLEVDLMTNMSLFIEKVAL